MAEEFDRERARKTFMELVRIDRLHRSAIEDFLSGFGIHRSQHMMLMYISKMERCPSQKEIAEHFKISSAAVTVTLKKLDEGGYIVRHTVKEDTRYNSITLSKKGKELVEKSRLLFEGADKAMFGDFSDEDYVLLSEFTKKMTDGLNEYCKGLHSNANEQNEERKI